MLLFLFSFLMATTPRGIRLAVTVWCICGYKRLSNRWTSNNKKLDEFIKESQLQTNSANDVYLDLITVY